MDNHEDTWTCPNCGELIEPAFDSCWQCGTARDGSLAVDPDAFRLMTRGVVEPLIVADANEEPSLMASLSPASLTSRCHVCSGTSYVWGTSSAFFTGVSDFRTSYALNARMCRGCGNVQTFVRPATP